MVTALLVQLAMLAAALAEPANGRGSSPTSFPLADYVRTAPGSCDKAKAVSGKPSLLEKSFDPEALAWVACENQRTLEAIASGPGFARALSVTRAAGRATDASESPAQINPYTYAVRGNWIYRYIRSLNRPKGEISRSSWPAFLAGHPRWHVLLDLAHAATGSGRSDMKSGRFQISNRGFEISPSGNRLLLTLYDASSGEESLREFDPESRSFVEKGFNLPAAAQVNAAWLDDDTILIQSPVAGEARTQSGESTKVFKWKRGTPRERSEQVFAGEASDAAIVLSDDGASAIAPEAARGTVTSIVNRVDKEANSSWWLSTPDGRFRKATLPPTKTIQPLVFKGRLIYVLGEDWTLGSHRFEAGSVLATSLESAFAGDPDASLVEGPDKGISWIMRAKDALALIGSNEGTSSLDLARLERGRWQVQKIRLPAEGTAIPSYSTSESATALLTFNAPLVPPSLLALDTRSGDLRTLQKDRPAFDPSRFRVERRLAQSADGTQIPYYVIAPTQLRPDGRNRALIEAYGAFGAPPPPLSYSPERASLWLGKGNLYVIAEVRGGAGNSKSWWVTGPKRQRTYEDLEAVALDLGKRRLSAPGYLAVIGHSAGGLLAAVSLNRRPDLFGAAVMEAALLDQFRMDLVGSSAILFKSEFGDIANERDRRFLEATSPTQNVNPAIRPPGPLIITTTTDDNVLPAQARLYAARFKEKKIPYHFLETAEGGHSMAANPAQQAWLEALVYTYLDWALPRP
jgi:prolyl oligopeptidase